MAASIIILSPTDSDAAALAASSAQSDSLGVTNLQDIQPKRKHRFTGCAAEYVTLDAGAAGIAGNGLSLIGHNFTAAATIRVRGKATSDVTVSPTVDTGAVSAWPASGKPADRYWPQFLSWVAWSNVTALRYWRFDYADAANPDGYIQAGRLHFGAYWQPPISVDLSGVPLGRDQRDVQTPTDYGETFTDRRNRSAPRLFKMQIGADDHDDVLNGIGEIQRLRGMWGDVTCLLRPDATTHFHRHSMQGLFTMPQEHQITQAFAPSGRETWTVSFPLRELT